MKITKMSSIPLSIPLDHPFGNRNQQANERVYLVIVKLTADNGLKAFGLTYTLNSTQVKSLKACIDDLENVIIGQDVFRWAEAWTKLYETSKHMGRHGYSIYALAAIDTALWILRAKVLELPLSRLLGGFRDRVPAYASYLLFRNWGLDELERDAALLVERGFHTVKMNLGDKPFDEEIERIKTVRGVVGEDVDIMVDVNWAWSVYDAIKMGRKLEEYNIYWMEDPLASDDPDQLAQVANALDMPVAIGETYCTKYGIRPLIEKRAMDILIVDLQKVGGVTEWIKVAAIAEAWNISVASHIFPEFSMHLVAAVPNGLIVEYMPWWDKIYINPPEVKNGYLEIPQIPGLGLELDNEAIKKYAYK